MAHSSFVVYSEFITGGRLAEITVYIDGSTGNPQTTTMLDCIRCRPYLAQTASFCGNAVDAPFVWTSGAALCTAPYYISPNILNGTITGSNGATAPLSGAVYKIIAFCDVGDIARTTDY